ncbi:AAA family ATPase [Hyphomicrobium sp.]|uniref:AAA family ATPase n=1 Tax=Hyphomicrobium sp. TaxID=82 RepID=UPI002C3F6EC5|nr:AAA family ATPase [Hyphomicrobium sp.]HRQ27085.1 AAA family ATPase [Hyphomicrobium sp.]
MKIKELHVRSWRHFENLSITLEDNVPLVCIVGANGTGKSHLLELIAACAHKLGLSQGVDIPRGDPFADVHDFTATFLFARGIKVLDDLIANDPSSAAWDRKITIESTRGPAGTHLNIRAGGIADPAEQTAFARRITDCLSRSEAVHFVSLDADRSYPKRSYNIHEVAQAYETDWSTSEYTRGRSYKPTTNLYDEWIKYFLARENQAGTKLLEDIRRARDAGTAEPTFSDHFQPYTKSLQQVLPHLVFVGVDLKERTLRFDMTLPPQGYPI